MGQDVVQRAIDAARARHQEYLPMLESWVRQNSFSSAPDNVNAMADLLTAGFDLPGFSCQRHAGGQVGDHLTFTTPAWERAPEARCVLIGHHDTVFPPGAFETWEIDGDILRGPGVLDMKGGLMIVRTALAALHDIGVLADMPLALLSVGDEEIGSMRSRDLTQAFCQGAKAGLVFEAGRANDMIVTARKGTGLVEVQAVGRAAHSGNDHAAGRSAIRALCRFVECVEQYTDYERGLLVNVGVFHGGEATNTVPGHAMCGMSIRFSETQAGYDMVERMRRDAAALTAETEVQLNLDADIGRPAMQRTDASLQLFQTYAESAQAAGLGGDECPEVSGGSDANLVSAIGVPAIDGLGPRGRGFHTKDEFIELSSVPLKTEALLRCLLSVAPPITA